ncbi:1,3-beta-glucanosyltransferase [Pleurostoma richardsiae]|uniref:1,3-beta-glucanosyltransferase n=1 Tax=Pleurostoma richardsiae TaxID=41990 RepID=A0AA38RJ50_9PEZI|nr:1,3-beta-glucanosyltransferase [Pleurostoma richardsiae]
MAKTIEPVTIRGRYLWRGGERFLIKGVVYQDHRRPRVRELRPDPIADDRLEDVRRDVALFKELGLNTIFLFWVDNSKSHDAVMKLLADAGIYVLVGLSNLKHVIQRSNPYDSYNATLLEDYFKTVDCMAAYNNTLGVLVGNEVINSAATTSSASVLRALTRDVKRYMALAADASGQRCLPVGYSSADVPSLLKPCFDFFTAGGPDERLDFFAFNNYSWAGKASMQISGYDRQVKQFSDAHVPVFFSEYGANVASPRIFEETTAIYSREMTHVFSGGIVYEFWYGANEYGLVKQETDEEGQSVVVKLDDFKNLKDRLNGCKEKPNTDPKWADPAFTSSVERDFPDVSAFWKERPRLPESPVDWEEVRDRVEMREWVDLRKELDEEAVDDLADIVEAQLRLSRKAGDPREPRKQDLNEDVEAKLEVFHETWA